MLAINQTTATAAERPGQRSAAWSEAWSAAIVTDTPCNYRKAVAITAIKQNGDTLGHPIELVVDVMLTTTR